MIFANPSLLRYPLPVPGILRTSAFPDIYLYIHTAFGKFFEGYFFIGGFRDR